MRLSTYLLSLAITWASADVSFGPPPNNPTFPVPNPMHPTFFPPPPKDAHPTHGYAINPLTRRQEITQPTPFSPFPGGHPGGHKFVGKYVPISSTDPIDPSAPPPAHSSILVSDIDHSTYAVFPYTTSAFTGTIQPPQPSGIGFGGEYTSHPSPLPTSGLFISSLPTSIVDDTSTPGYSQGTGSHSVSQTIVSTLAVLSTPIAVTPNPGGPMSTTSIPPSYLNFTVTTKSATSLTTSTKVTTSPAPSHTGSGSSASGSSTASPSATSLGNMLEWNAVLAVAGLMGAFAFGIL